MIFQNFFDVLSRLCQGNGYKAISHFKCLRKGHNSVLRATHAAHELRVDQASLKDIRTSTTISRSYTQYVKVRRCRRTAGYGQRHHLLSTPTTEQPRWTNETYTAIKMDCTGYKYMPDCTAGVHKSQAKNQTKCRRRRQRRVGRQYRTRFTSHFWRLGFWGGWQSFGIFLRIMLYIHLYAQKSDSVLLHMYGYKMRAK